MDNQDAFAPVDLAAEIADGETRHRHAEGAGIDGKADRRRHDAVMARERRENSLGREKVYDSEEGCQSDDGRTKEDNRRVSLGLAA
jgi:hypothetical protein